MKHLHADTVVGPARIRPSRWTHTITVALFVVAALLGAALMVARVLVPPAGAAPPAAGVGSPGPAPGS